MIGTGCDVFNRVLIGPCEHSEIDHLESATASIEVAFEIIALGNFLNFIRRLFCQFSYSGGE